MHTSASRRAVVAVACATAVLLPLGGALAAAGVAWGLATGAAPVLDPASALLRLASAGLALVLLWACAAVTAGVLDGWQRAHVRTVAAPVGPGPQLRPARPAALVSTAVAALVVAALTAPAASADVHPPAASVVATAPGGGSDAATPPQAADDLADPEHPEGLEARADVASPAPLADAPTPGSWSGLAGDGFVAPRGAAPDAVGLVSSPATRPVQTPDEVVVTAGDTLWSLAADRLGAGASDAEVAAAWPAWWEANRSVIGDDPDHLLPGQRLVVPAP